MAQKRTTRNWTKIKRGLIKFGLAGLVKLALIVILGVAGVTTFSAALITVFALGFTGYGAFALASLPDALMVLSSARQRQAGLAVGQRIVARRAMRFGLTFSLLTNMIAAFLAEAPNGSWIDLSSERAVWMQHAVFGLSIIWHAAPVLVLWYTSEMLTRKAAEPASLRRPSKILAILMAILGSRKILAQNRSQTVVAAQQEL